MGIATAHWGSSLLNSKVSFDMSEVMTVPDLASCVFRTLLRCHRRSHYELAIGRLKGHFFWSDGESIWLIDLAAKKLEANPISCRLFNGPVREQVIEWLQKSPADREISQAGSLFSVIHDSWASDWHSCPYSLHKKDEPYLFGDWIFQHRGEMDDIYSSRAEALAFLRDSASANEPKWSDWTDISF